MQCNEKTLYDKTIARRVRTASRRSKRTAASVLALGLLAGASASSMSPANAAPDFTGFTTFALATPLRVEIYEPAIPVPSSPQLEFNFSYTKVQGASGPIGSARASAMWPGDAVGEGLKTFGEQLGLPGPLTDGGYPVQVNAQNPGDTQSASQEFLPGSVGRVSTTDKKATAKVGYGTAGDVADGDTGSTPPPNLLDLLKDPTGLTGILLGTKTDKDGGSTPSGSPLGALSALVNVAGMDSISSTSYDPESDTVTASATARLGTVGLLGGLIKLNGVEVVTKTVSNIAQGAVTTKKIDIGSMSILGNKFGYTGKGFEAMGKENPLPGLPDDAIKALAKLGVKFEIGESKVTKEGPVGSVSAEGLRIEIDTQPLLSLLPKLPLDELVGQLPDLPGQAAILKGLIVALGDAHPKVALVLGQSRADAQTVKGIDPDAVVTPPVVDTPVTDTPVADVPVGDVPITDPGAPAETPPGNAPTDPFVPQKVSGLPPLGSIPMALLLGGLMLAAGLGWYIRRAGLIMFGGSATCAHGLKAGIPDLRKV
ncbi:hypothetical protein [Marmoricola sp. OAE513]|uniref:hypothetical protein n=1 Tax=Marmoricola sp. OAE513 TaxID=2817894 RepID=UPI001AE18DAE